MPAADLVTVRNPMAATQAAMRASLLPGLLSVVETNLNRGVDGGMVFEIGRVFSVSRGERDALGGVLFGRTGLPLAGKERVSLPLTRGIVDRLFEGGDTLHVIGLAAATESRLLNEMGDEGEALLSPVTLDALNEAAERALAEQERDGYPAVLLTSPSLRAILSRLLRRNLPRLSVIAYAEVPADKMVQVNTELSIGGGA